MFTTSGTLFQMCRAIDGANAGNDTFARLYGAANVYYNTSGSVQCFSLADHSDPHGLDGWQWQVPFTNSFVFFLAPEQLVFLPK